MQNIYELFKKVKSKGFRGTYNSLLNKTKRRFLIPAKMRQIIKQSRNYSDINEIRKKTLLYIKSLEIEGYIGRYKYSKSQNEPVLYASVFAILTLHLYREIDNLTVKEKNEWIKYIKSFQAEDGLFKDPLIENEIASKADWWGWRHLTLHTTMALTALDTVVDKRFSFLEPFKNKSFTLDWLESRKWNLDPAEVSNEIQNYTALLQYSRDFLGVKWASDTVNWILDWLDKKQDPNTGLWGFRFDTPYFLSQGVQTGYHIWLLYFYDKRPLNYVDKIIDSVLATQNILGGFGVALNSSACEDIDSIDPLCRLYFISNYRREDIKKALEKALYFVLANMNEDGGFVFRRFEPFEYGHERMSSKENESAIFPTWFRTLSLAYISKVLPDSIVGKFDWQFLDCPGLQFWR